MKIQAIPCISTGNFGYPRDLAVVAAFEATLNWLASIHEADLNRIDKIYFVTYDKIDMRLYDQAKETVNLIFY